MVASWWNTKYTFRRQLRITGTTADPILAGHPIYVTLDKATILGQGKVLASFADLEVLLYNPDLATPTWTVLGRNVDSDDNYIYVTFNAVGDISGVNTNYYIYMDNPTLTNVPSRPSYVYNTFFLTTTPTSGLGLSFTKPNEDWNNGLTSVIGARAAFIFTGPAMRITAQKTNISGQLSISLDNGTPQVVDLYSSSSQGEQVVVYTLLGMSYATHSIRMVTLSDSNPASSGHDVQIIKIEYSKYFPVQDLGEEINTSGSKLTVILGI